MPPPATDGGGGRDRGVTERKKLKIISIPVIKSVAQDIASNVRDIGSGHAAGATSAPARATQRKY